MWTCPSSVAKFLLGPFSECRFCKRSGVTPWSLSDDRPVLLPTRFLVESRRILAVSSAGRLRPSLVARLVVRTGAALLALASRRAGWGILNRLSWRSASHRLDANVVFLVGTPNFDSECFRDA